MAIRLAQIAISIVSTILPSTKRRYPIGSTRNCRSDTFVVICNVSGSSSVVWTSTVSMCASKGNLDSSSPSIRSMGRRSEMAIGNMSRVTLPIPRPICELSRRPTASSAKSPIWLAMRSNCIRSAEILEAMIMRSNTSSDFHPKGCFRYQM